MSTDFLTILVSQDYRHETSHPSKLHCKNESAPNEVPEPFQYRSRVSAHTAYYELPAQDIEILAQNTFLIVTE